MNIIVIPIATIATKLHQVLQSNTYFSPPLSLCLDISIDIIGQDVDDSDRIKEKEKLVDNKVPLT
jgi:hypothetical protein